MTVPYTIVSDHHLFRHIVSYVDRKAAESFAQTLRQQHPPGVTNRVILRKNGRLWHVYISKAFKNRRGGL